VLQQANAEKTYLLALNLAEADNDSRLQANILNNLAAINIMQNNHQEAIKYVQKSLPIFRSINHKNGEVHALVFVAHCNFAHKPIEAQAYKGLGDVYHKLEAYPEALKYYQKALTIAISIEDHHDVCDLYMSLSNTYLKMDNEAAAKKAIHEAKTTAKAQELNQKLSELEKYEQEHF